MSRPSLIFVYNADSGFFNTAVDIAHKLISPSTYSCRLCELTHSYFQVRQEWKSVLPQLEADCTFMHRDEFRRAFPEENSQLPAIFILRHGNPELWLDQAALTACTDLTQLIDLIRTQLTKT